MRIEADKKNNDQLNGLAAMMSALGFAVGIIVAPVLINKVLKLGDERISYDYYKIVDSLIKK